MPLSVFLNPELSSGITGTDSWIGLSEEVWLKQVRPLAVGTMIVASFHTLFKLRNSLFRGIRRAVKDLQTTKESGGESNRLNIDLDFRWIGAAIACLSIPLFFLYLHFSGSGPGSALLTVVMIVLGFLFAAVAGYLVGLLGSSNNPISGLTLSTLLISAILMVMIGVTGEAGIMAVLGVAGVVCCAAGIAGDMIQDLKVGHILGGTPWKMEVAEMIGVIIAAFVLVWPLIAMDRVYGIGSPELPAPQAGLMALMSRGIVGGEMAWPLVIAGIFFAVALILIKAPSPMLIAVGMYLPFHSTAAIFVGGIFRWILDKKLAKNDVPSEGRARAVNSGVLLSSGFIAGEALMAVSLAFLVLGSDLFGWGDVLPSISENPWLGMLIFGLLLYLLVKVPLGASQKKGGPSMKLES